MYKHLFARSFKEETRSVVRVNYAGEYGAVQIYKSQISAFPNDEKITHMLDSEVKHFEYFKKLNVQPTIFMPLWHALSISLGWITAKHSRKMAMLYTEAVEHVVAEHYREQIEYLENTQKFYKNEDLLLHVKQFLQDEIEHGSIGNAEGMVNKTLFKMFTLTTKIPIEASKIA